MYGVRFHPTVGTPWAFSLTFSKDRTGKRYLCSCCRLCEEWVIEETSTTLLLRLLDNKIAIREAFIGDTGTKFFVVWDGKKFDYGSTIPDDALPKAGANLDLPQAKASEFAAQLRLS